MKPAELVALLQECYRDRLALVERHKAVAVHVSNYDANNTYQYVINRDARAGAAFLAKWRPRVESLSHARNQTMLRLMLGEVQEQTRLLEQAGNGTADVLGHSDTGAGSRGVVAGARWFGD